MLRGEPPVIYGDGRQTRDFTYIDDVVRASLLAAEAPPAQVAGKVFNVGGGRSISLLQVIEELNRLTGQTLAPRFEPPRVGDVMHSVADITAIQRAVGFHPKVTWQQGLQRSLEYYGGLVTKPEP
jgi:UDP-glucose 4-epimerase